MGSRSIERKLSKTGSRLSALRREIDTIDEQLRSLADDADDSAVRALVAENSAATREAREAREHADAHRRQRERVIAEIAELEVRQDALLDRLIATD